MWATTTTKRKVACICFVVDHVVDVDVDGEGWVSEHADKREQHRRYTDNNATLRW